MKFKTPKSYVPALSTIGGAVLGAMASRIGYNMLPETKESSTETLYKGAIAAVSGAGAVFIDGNDALTNFVRGAFIGASVEQGLSLVKQIAKDSKVESKLVKQAVGLACPCQEKTLGNPLQRGRVIPLIQTSTPPFNPYGNTTHSNPPYDHVPVRGSKEEEWEKKLEEMRELAKNTTI